MPHIPKGVFKRSSHNPNAWAAQNYFIVEDLAQAPCALCHPWKYSIVSLHNEVHCCQLLGLLIPLVLR
jgi:hypothetical protein